MQARIAPVKITGRTAIWEMRSAPEFLMDGARKRARNSDWKGLIDYCTKNGMDWECVRLLRPKAGAILRSGHEDSGKVVEFLAIKTPNVKFGNAALRFLERRGLFMNVAEIAARAECAEVGTMAVDTLLTNGRKKEMEKLALREGKVHGSVALYVELCLADIDG